MQHVGRPVRPLLGELTPFVGIALMCAGVLALLLASGALFGIVVPAGWLAPAALMRASASATLFCLNLGPLGLLAHVFDAIIGCLVVA